MRAQTPARFTMQQQIEVATADETFSTTLAIGNGIKLENSKVALASLEPAKAFGFSAFGPLKFRPVVNGVAGDWQALATLVRLPVLKTLKCPADSKLACVLSGTDLFLIDSISGNAQFEQAVQVSDGFPGASLPVPHPTGGKLYVKLRSEEHTSELQSLMRTSYACFCLTKKIKSNHNNIT